jgi:hypothetical protein
MNTENETLKTHPFARTLGPAPYSFVGTFDLGACLAALQAGNVNGYNNGLAMAPKVEAGMGTCAHCGMAITLICLVKTGENKLYGVGSDCINKVGLPVAELSKLERAKRERDKAMRQARKARKGDAAREELRGLMASQSERMSSLPHPSFPNKTLLDYAAWVAERSNDGGIVIALARVKAALI